MSEEQSRVTRLIELWLRGVEDPDRRRQIIMEEDAGRERSQHSIFEIMTEEQKELLMKAGMKLEDFYWQKE